MGGKGAEKGEEGLNSGKEEEKKKRKKKKKRVVYEEKNLMMTTKTKITKDRNKTGQTNPKQKQTGQT